MYMIHMIIYIWRNVRKPRDASSDGRLVSDKSLAESCLKLCTFSSIQTTGNTRRTRLLKLFKLHVLI